MAIGDSLSRTESGGNFQAQNNAMGAGGMAGHYGRLQFGRARLQDAERAGVLPAGTTPEQFMANPALQERVEAWHLQDMASQAQRMGLDRYIGQEVGGVPITMDAILAMGHLGGMGGAAEFLRSGGQHNPSDIYGTSLRDYAVTHGRASGQQTASQQGQASQPQYVDTSGLMASQNALSQAPQMTPEQIDRAQRLQALSLMPQQEPNQLNAADFMRPTQNALAPMGFGPGQSVFT